MKRKIIEYPTQNISITNTSLDKLAVLPFQLLQCGFSNSPTFSLETNYSNYVVFYLVEGRAVFTKHKITTIINNKNIVVSNCSTKISFSKKSSDWRYFYIVFSGSHAKLYYNMIRDQKGIIPISPLYNITPYFIDLCKLTCTKELFSQMQSCYLIHQVIHMLVVITHEINKARLITPLQQAVVFDAKKYISEHYKEDISVDSICQQMNFSKSHFCKLFKDQTGTSLYQYLTQYRVNKSKEYLAYSQVSIHATAINVGFKNTLTYSRCFKRYTGMTPSEYRTEF